MQARVHARRSLTGDMDWDVEDPLHDAFLIVFYFIQALLMLNFFLAIILVSYDKCVQRVVDQVRPLPVPARYNAFFFNCHIVLLDLPDYSLGLYRSRSSPSWQIRTTLFDLRLSDATGQRSNIC